MKKVFQKSELAHVWASQTQDEGRTATRNFYFYGTKIFSYGSHFCIANITKIGDKEVVFINNNKYSNTTSDQVSLVRRAASHKKLFWVNDPENISLYSGGFWKNIRCFYSDYIQALNDAAKPRIRAHTRVNHKKDAIAELNNIKEFIALFGLTPETIKNKDQFKGKQFEPAMFKQLFAAVKNVDSILTEEDDQALENHKVAAKKLAVAREKKEAEQKKEQKRRGNEALEAWIKHEDPEWNNHLYYADHVGLRQNETDEVETSLGARVPYEVAKKLYNRLKQGENINGSDIGRYTVIGNGKDRITIGCHIILKTEIERFAKTQNW